MPRLLKKSPVEGSTAEIECVFKDTGNNMVNTNNINSIKWTLKDNYLNTINERENVEENIENPLNVVLTGDDLPSGQLTFTIFVSYNSNLGNNLQLKDSITFFVEDLRYNN